MKTATYKRTDKGVVEINNEINDLQGMVLKAYNSVFTGIKNGRYTFGLNDLQNAVTSVLERLNDLELTNYDDVFKYLVSACSKRKKYEIRQAISLDLMKDIQCEYFIENNGISDTYIAEVLQQIKGILSDTEYNLFRLYHVIGYNQSDIAKMLDTYQRDVSRKLDLIAAKIATLKISYLFENRYVAYQSKKKRRYVRYDDYQESSGNGYAVAIDDYKPIEFNQEVIPSNKAMQYPTKRYYKVKRDDFGYIGHSGKSENYYISSGVYANSKVVKNGKGKQLTTYRIKKLKRQFVAVHGQKKYNDLMNKSID